MKEIKNVKFECRQCGSSKLGYIKYVKCLTPVTIKDDNNIEYGLSVFDEDDYLATDDGFCCLDCSHIVEHCGCRFQTEKQLLAYLTMVPETKKQQENDYQETLEAEIDRDLKDQKFIDEFFDISDDDQSSS